MLWNLAPTAVKFCRAVAALKNLPWRLGRQVGNVFFHAIASPVRAARTLDKSANKQARKVLLSIYQTDPKALNKVTAEA